MHGRGNWTEVQSDQGADGDPRPGREQDEVRHRDGEAVGPDRLPAPLGIYQRRDSGTAGDGEDTEPDPPDRRESEDDAELVAECQHNAGGTQQDQSNSEHQTPPEAPQSARDE